MIFHIGGQYFGIDVSFVKGVYRASQLPVNKTSTGQMVKMPHGQKLFLYDLCSILAKDHCYMAEPIKKIMHLSYETTQLAILVDQVERVITADLLLKLPPVFKGKSTIWFSQVLSHENNLILLINPEIFEKLK